MISLANLVADLSDYVLRGYRERVYASPNTAFDLANGNVQTHTLTSYSVVTVTGFVDGDCSSLTLHLDGVTASRLDANSFGSEFKWLDGEVPYWGIPSNSSVALEMYSLDGGATINTSFGFYK